MVGELDRVIHRQPFDEEGLVVQELGEQFKLVSVAGLGGQEGREDGVAGV